MFRCARHAALRSRRTALQRNHCANSFSRHNVGAMHPRTVGRPPRRTPVGPSSAFHANAVQRPHHAHAFTLIELLVVIAIIAILIGLLFPAFKAVQNQARQAQAKNDLTQIVNAVNAFYTDYGKYPLGMTADTTYGPGGTPTTNETLFTELRGCTAATGSCPDAATINTRQIVFISPPDVKNSASPRSGIGISRSESRANTSIRGATPYVIRIDGNYNNQVANPYTANTGAGAESTTIGVIAWSLGSGSGRSGMRRQEHWHCVRRRDFVAVIFADSPCCSVRCPQRIRLAIHQMR